MTRDEIDALRLGGRTLREVQDIMRSRGEHLCCDCQHGIFRFVESNGQRYPHHYCELHPNDGYYMVHIDYLSTAHPDERCRFHPKTNKE